MINNVHRRHLKIRRGRVRDSGLPHERVASGHALRRASCHSARTTTSHATRTSSLPVEKRDAVAGGMRNITKMCKRQGLEIHRASVAWTSISHVSIAWTSTTPTRGCPVKIPVPPPTGGRRSSGRWSRGRWSPRRPV